MCVREKVTAKHTKPIMAFEQVMLNLDSFSLSLCINNYNYESKAPARGREKKLERN